MVEFVVVQVDAEREVVVVLLQVEAGVVLVSVVVLGVVQDVDVAAA